MGEWLLEGLGNKRGKDFWVSYRKLLSESSPQVGCIINKKKSCCFQKSISHKNSERLFSEEHIWTRRECLKSALYLRLKKRKTLFWEKTRNFWKKNSFGKCRTVPKIVKGGPFLICKHAFCSKLTKNSKGGPAIDRNPLIDFLANFLSVCCAID